MYPTTEKEAIQEAISEGYVRVYRVRSWDNPEDSAEILEVFRPDLMDQVQAQSEISPFNLFFQEIESKSVWGGCAWSTLTTSDVYCRF